MGTTTAALHVLPASAASAEALAAAYAAAGWAPSEAGTRHAAVLAADGAATVLDSACEHLDDGTLKALAAWLSRTPGTLALVASVEDSDAFELLLYAGGAQVDAVTGGGAEPQGLATLAPAARPAGWTRLLGRPPGPLPGDLDTPFAEDALEAWLAAAGVPPGRTGLRLADLDPSIPRLALAPAPRATAPAGPPPALATFHDDDDCRQHRTYPGAWPLPSGRPAGLRWVVLSGAGGFDGLSVSLTVSELRGTIALTRLRATAYPFHNGQLTSMTPVADCELAPGPLAEGTRTLDLAPFAIPALDPAAKARLAILLGAELRLDPGAAARLAPSVTPLDRPAPPLALPPVRVHAPALAWTPLTADPADDGVIRAEALRALNEPAILSGVAILGDDGEAARAAIEAAARRFLAALSPAPGTTATLRTAKHMTASGSVARNTVTVPLPDLASDKLWKRAFAAKSDLQTVHLRLTPPGFHLPVAGVSLQTTLRPLPGEAPRPPAPHLSLWMADHPEAEAALGLSPAALADLFRATVAETAPLQAHLLRAAWIPEFDLYTGFARTPLEELSGTDWFRAGLDGTLMGRDWCARRLRLLAPEMWLSDALLGPADPAALAAVAETERQGPVTRIRLRNGQPMAALEAALAPLLPA